MIYLTRFNPVCCAMLFRPSSVKEFIISVRINLSKVFYVAKVQYQLHTTIIAKMIPSTAHQHYVSSSSNSTMDMTSFLFNALYERSLQERFMSQDVAPQQQHSIVYRPSNSVHDNLPSSVSLDGKLYALLPMKDQGISATSVENHQSQPVGRSNMVEQYRDDLNISNRGNTTTSSVVQSIVSNSPTRSILRKKGKDARGTKHRPKIHVPPLAFFSIQEPCVNDVLMGRGGRINKHAGNVQLRNIVASRQEEYLSSSTGKLDKAYIAADIVAAIRLQCHPPGRFLEQNTKDHTWYEVGDARAIRKVLQALRENAPEFRPSTTIPSSNTSSTLAQQTAM